MKAKQINKKEFYTCNFESLKGLQDCVDWYLHPQDLNDEKFYKWRHDFLAGIGARIIGYDKNGNETLLGIKFLCRILLLRLIRYYK